MAEKPDWGGEMLDFTACEHAGIGLKPLNATGKDCAIGYFHVAHGRPDFSTGRVRCKLLPAALVRESPSQQKLPYNVDFLSWARGNFFLNAPDSQRVKEIRDGLNLGLFFPMQAGEILQCGKRM